MPYSRRTGVFINQRIYLSRYFVHHTPPPPVSPPPPPTVSAAAAATATTSTTSITTAITSDGGDGGGPADSTDYLSNYPSIYLSMKSLSAPTT